jgi:hypothetical protein
MHEGAGGSGPPELLLVVVMPEPVEAGTPELAVLPPFPPPVPAEPPWHEEAVAVTRRVPARTPSPLHEEAMRMRPMLNQAHVGSRNFAASELRRRRPADPDGTPSVRGAVACAPGDALERRRHDVARMQAAAPLVTASQRPEETSSPPARSVLGDAA